MVRPLLILIFLLSLYHTLTVGKVLPSSEGISIEETNYVKVEKYVYHDSKIDVLLVGSSRTAKLNPQYISDDAQNLGMRGFSSTLGLELVKNTELKPSIVLVEINGTIGLTDEELIKSLFDPLTYYTRLYFPMFRTEYRPVSVFIQAVRNLLEKLNIITLEEIDQARVNPAFREKRIQEEIKEKNQPLSQKRKTNLRQDAKSIKSKIEKIEKSGVRVLLYDVPGDPRLDSTRTFSQERELLRKLFPSDKFEWLPDPPTREWVTSDGIHLISTDAKIFAEFIRDQLKINSSNFSEKEAIIAVDTSIRKNELHGRSLPNDAS
ncbi:hypothetical protein MC7420_920 [Coleofasciculus chthonoplastes PCC 7420]|uniref:Uncharacterized protein n=2 Tax=Coleofasciculus chthonoplastes TaxID=64178 RepID=B4W5D7_9CYAN|nr:hypothetical protein MC7420_920 [Coleofasciculus chthonoplastes PCC 7420]